MAGKFRLGVVGWVSARQVRWGMSRIVLVRQAI